MLDNISLAIGFSAAFSILFQSHAAESRKALFARIAALFVLLSSVVPINYLVPANDAFGPSSVAMTFAFSFVFASFPTMFLVSSRGRLRMLAAIPLALGLFSFLALWIYFLHSGHWLDGDAAVAVWQTYPAEAWSFWQKQMGIKGTVALIAALCFSVLFSRWFFDLRGTHLLAPKKVLSVFLAVCHAASIGFFCYLVCGSIYNRIGSEGYYAIKGVSSFREHESDRKAVLAGVPKKRSGGLHVLVIGESENRDYMHAYGYDKETTPWLDSVKGSPDCVFFEKPYANHVHTVPSLAYALTEKSQYNDMNLEKSVSVIDVAKAAGYKTFWLGNQGRNGYADTPTTVIADTADESVFLNRHQMLDIKQSYDEGLVEAFDDVLISLASFDEPDAFVVIHLLGCHDNYVDRYPEDRDVFGHDTNEETYENAVRYNDEILDELYETAKKSPYFRDFVYFSDHGEAVKSGKGHEPSVYEASMSRIPFFILFSEDGIGADRDAYNALRSNTSKPWTNDLAYEVLVTLMGIEPPHRIEQKDNIASFGYDGDIARFRTLHGELGIE